MVTHTDHSSGTTSKTRHLHKDAQGSTIAITGEAVSGNVLKQQINYDPWGKQSTLWSHSSFVYGLNLGDMRGYTGHTVVDDLDLVHMGGRTYNPVLGRFMQADPFIQAGANLQNYNRYSYVLNNPLSYTDPSGYFFKKLNKMLGDFAPIVGMVIMMIPGGQSVGASMLAGFIGGGIATGNLQGAIVGMFGATMGANLNMLEVENTVKFLTSAITSGIGAAVQGGDFAHGFISASLGQLANTGNAGFDLVAGAIVGGTMSKVVGGKFANGAVSAAMGTLTKYMASSGTRRLHGASSSSATYSEENIRAAWEEMREYSEIASIEAEKGNFNLTVDASKVTGYESDSHTININPESFGLEYKTVIHAGFEESISHLSNAAWFDAMHAYPEYYRFSVERVLFHEAMHGVQNGSGLRYSINTDSYEIPVIRQTNEFMFKHYGEPFRKDHTSVRPRK